MFARIVTVPLKSDTASEYAQAIEKGAIPLLRKHKGFLDEISLVTPDGKVGMGISFWDSKASAEAYERSGFTDVMKTLDKVLAGPTQVQTYEVTNSTPHKIAAARVA